LPAERRYLRLCCIGLGSSEQNISGAVHMAVEFTISSPSCHRHRCCASRQHRQRPAASVCWCHGVSPRKGSRHEELSDKVPAILIVHTILFEPNCMFTKTERANKTNREHAAGDGEAGRIYRYYKAAFIRSLTCAAECPPVQRGARVQTS
jgi:hypothetical protein